jgi:hypothetical protein
MNIRNEKWGTLEEILDTVWRMLERGAATSRDPFHWPALGTATNNGCSLRTVILRHVDSRQRTVVCHTDARAPKVAEIKEQPTAGWLFYHPEKRVQVRLSGRAALHDNDPFADRQWADASLTSRLNYCASQPPGTPIDKPSSGLPDFLLKKVPTLVQTEMGRKHFMAIAMKIDAIDWLMLKVSGNRRARFEWGNDKFHATWLVP